MSTERVALVDSAGREIGSAPRDRVRRENLLHAATAVLVRNSSGEIYLAQRSPLKDWCPGHWDAAAGGVLRPGEAPLHSAERELAEELGIVGAPLESLGGLLFQDATNRVYERVFTTCWDGPLHYADGEVVGGRWASLAELARRLADPDWLFVPDTRALLADLGRRGVADYGLLGCA
ncbi:MAG: NUDIX hydrolase [Candidatus Nanopelagicales bacterium]